TEARPGQSAQQVCLAERDKLLRRQVNECVHRRDMGRSIAFLLLRGESAPGEQRGQRHLALADSDLAPGNGKLALSDDDTPTSTDHGPGDRFLVYNNGDMAANGDNIDAARRVKGRRG